MEKLVAIIDEMSEYATQLAVFLNGRKNFPYRAVAFSEVPEAERYVKQDAVYAILAAKCFEKQVLELAVGTKAKVFWLMDSEQEKDAMTLYRYCSATKVEQKLVQEKEQVTRFPVYGVFSPVGGMEFEPLSYKIAEKFGRTGRVLYLSFLPFGMCGRAGTDGLSEILFFLRQRSPQMSFSFSEFVQRGECVDVLGPVRWYTDLDSVTNEDMERLLHLLEQSGTYDAVVVAVGWFDRIGRTVLRFCDRIFIPVPEWKEGHRGKEEFLRQLKESGETKIYSCVSEVRIVGTGEEALEEAAAKAYGKGGEKSAGYSGRDSQADPGTVGFVGRTDR